MIYDNGLEYLQLVGKTTLINQLLDRSNVLFILCRLMLLHLLVGHWSFAEMKEAFQLWKEFNDWHQPRPSEKNRPRIIES